MGRNTRQKEGVRRHREKSSLRFSELRLLWDNLGIAYQKQNMAPHLVREKGAKYLGIIFGNVFCHRSFLRAEGHYYFPQHFILHCGIVELSN